MKYANACWLLLCSFWTSAADAQINLTYVGAVRLPAIGANQFGPKYPIGYVALAAVPHQPDKLYLSVDRTIGVIQLPVPQKVDDLQRAPMATWFQPRVEVGQEFRDRVAAALGPSQQHWALLNGMAVHGDRLILNYGRYYAVDPSTQPNLSTLSLALAGETRLVDVAAPRPHIKEHGGWIAAVPTGWHDSIDVVRGSYWNNPVDFGPRIQAVDLDSPEPAWRWALRYDGLHKAVPEWTENDTFTAGVFWQKPIASFTAPRYLLLAARKTSRTWYGPQRQGAQRDPCSDSQGWHSLTYKAELWAYSWADLAAAVSGNSASWKPLPKLRLALPRFNACGKVAGMAFQGNYLWVAEEWAAGRPGSDYNTVLHCYLLK